MNHRDPQRRELIGNLVDDLRPAKRPGRMVGRALIWLAGASLVIAAVMITRAPFRPGFADQLLSTPQFALESLLGAGAILGLSLAAFQWVIPGIRSSFLRLTVPAALMACWIGIMLYGIVEPALPPSMAGKRPHCFVEVFLLGLPALAVGIAMLRSFYPLYGGRTGAFIGLAAGAIPALLMQFACMYLVPHILQHHLIPGLMMAAVGAFAGFLFLKPP